MQVLLILEYWRAASTIWVISVMLLQKMSGVQLVHHLRHAHVRPGVESIRVLHGGDDAQDHGTGDVCSDTSHAPLGSRTSRLQVASCQFQTLNTSRVCTRPSRPVRCYPGSGE